MTKDLVGTLRYTQGRFEIGEGRYDPRRPAGAGLLVNDWFLE